MNQKMIFLFILMFILVIRSVRNVTDTDVIKRIYQVQSVSDAFVNKYGTCTLNTFLFLNTIGLHEFGDLSIDIMTSKRGLTQSQMSEYLKTKLSFETKWYSFNVPDWVKRDEKNNAAITMVIDRITEKLISLRSTYGFHKRNSVLTALNYISKSSGDKHIGHSVIVWLTSNDDVVIIDPQKIHSSSASGVMLYSSDTKISGTEIQSYSIQTYIRKYMCLDENCDIDILVSVHSQIDDVHGNRLNTGNPLLTETIARIRNAEPDMDEEDMVVEEL